tara:strand:- start:1162 stop:1470 length:309 start_codon:yes stop_codon:yes gene_type:complete
VFGTVFSLFGAKIRKKMRPYVLAGSSRQSGRVFNRHSYRWPVRFVLSLSAALVFVSLFSLFWFLVWLGHRKIFYDLAFRIVSSWSRFRAWLVDKFAVSTTPL